MTGIFETFKFSREILVDKNKITSLTVFSKKKGQYIERIIVVLYSNPVYQDMHDCNSIKKSKT